MFVLQAELGKGSFQELDQVSAVKPFTKYTGQAKSVKDIAHVIEAAVKVGIARNLCLKVQGQCTIHELKSL